ncbi:MAG: M20 family metallopeptidase [Verrucomicrobiales bacterium]|nr:M20 family metallopeptidase [Verrucomicrobiales bacterium]
MSDNPQPAVISLLGDLVRLNSINSHYPGGPGEKEMATFVRGYLDGIGLETWVQEPLPGRPNVIARLPGKDPTRRLILEAHLDTVSVTGMTIPPFEPVIADGRLHGRGSCDTKAGLAGMMQALAGIVEEGLTPPCEIWLAAVVDEEHTFQGVLSLCDQLRQERDHPGIQVSCAAIVAEPTELRLVTANKGVLRWRIHTRGTAAHSSKPHLGHNAIEDMAHIILALKEHSSALAARPAHPLVGAPTCSVGLIEGGVQVNFVPDHCVIELDRRLLPGESADAAIAEYDVLLKGLAERHPGFAGEIEPPYIADEAMETRADCPVATTAAKVLRDLGLDGAPHGVPFGCDATKLSRIGVPSLIFGPGSIDQAHGAVEYVEIAQVLKAEAFYRQMILGYTGK